MIVVPGLLEKDERTLYDAYNDKAGVTARFNLNVLERINRELGGNFDLSGFIHRSIYNRDRHRIEMHLISRKAQSVRVLGHSFSFRPGESIHTENSYKYSLERFGALATELGTVHETGCRRCGPGPPPASALAPGRRCHPVRARAPDRRPAVGTTRGRPRVALVQ